MNTLLTTAKKYINTTETAGAANNQTIMSWAKTLGLAYSGDSIPWCALFMSWVAYESGYQGLRTLWARNWLKIGKAISQPEIGCITILWRNSPNSSTGHVGIVTNISPNEITLLGGNQSNTVGYGTYPKTRVLGYRRLANLAGNEMSAKPKSQFFLIMLSATAFVGLSGTGIWLALNDKKRFQHES